MVQRNDDPGPIDRDPGPESDDEDDRLGEAIEEYLALAERDQAPDLEAFVARYDDLKDELRAALEGLELVHGLVGRGGSSGSGSSARGVGSARWLEFGHRIAGYRIVRELGRGGMGTVYEAVHVGLDRPVALKVLGTHAAPDSSARRRFLNEAKTAAGLHHTHIVPVFDVGQVGGLCYYAMQRIEGSGLDRVVRHLRRNRPPGAGPAGSSLVDVAGAPGSSSLGSRFGQIWLRVSPGWLWRQPRRVPPASRGPRGTSGGGHDRTEGAPAEARPGPEGLGLLPPIPCGDSTASWGSRRVERRDGREPDFPAHHDHPGDLAGSAIGLAGLPARKGSEATGRGDEPPPFEPPRGGAYFRWVASVGLQAADALAHAHHQGVIHRDVKPSNLLIDAGGNIWVTDFGLARRLADPGLTHHDSLLGTPRYMSPEQARTAGQVDGRTDVYSLGATLYELLTLRPPFDGQSAAELVDQIGRDDPVPPRKFEPRIPRDLETIVLKALAKRPADRYENASEFAEDLARYLTHAPVKARRISPIGRLWRVARRHPQIAAVTATAAALIVAITTYSYVRILGERAEAVAANQDLKKTLDSLEKANRETQAARRGQYLKTAQMLEALDGPDRRAQGLDQIRKAVALGIPGEERAEFRDEAVKFLVMRDVETRSSLATGRGDGLTFGPQGHRLWAFTEEGDDLALWDIEHGRQLMSLPLRGRSSPTAGEPEPTAGGPSGGERGEPVQGAGAAPAGTAGRARPRAATTPGLQRIAGRSVALAGNYVAAILPDGGGVQLIDAMAGTALRKLTSPGHAILGVIADPGGLRLLTIEQILEPPTFDEELLTGSEEPTSLHPYVVNLWDLDDLERRPLDPWQEGRPGSSPGRPASPRDRGRPDRPMFPPLVAISPDGKTIAIAPSGAKGIRLFSASGDRPKPRRDWIDTQSEVTALALGPNDMLAAAARDQVRVYDADSGGATLVFQTRGSLGFIRLMRYSPLGTLALGGGGGPIELWDPAAQSRIAVLTGSDRPADLAFSPDGRTLAAVGRTGSTSLWTIQDSAARAQLSGFDAWPSSLAFGPDGTLVGASDGEVWAWRSGRCPETALSRSPSPVGGRGWSWGRGLDRPTALAFDAEGRLVVHDGQSLRIWPAGTVSAQAPPQFQVRHPVRERAWPAPIAGTPDGRIMALLRSSIHSSSVSLWRSQEPDRLIPVTPPPRPETAAPRPQPAPPAGGVARASSSAVDDRAVRFRAIQIAPRGDRLYLIDMNGWLHAWDLSGPTGAGALHASETGSGLPRAEGYSSVAIRRDGAVLALGDRTGTVTLLDTSRLAVLGVIRPPGDGTGGLILALSFSPDGRHLAVGSQQGTISLYSVESPGRPRLRLRLPGHRGLVNHLVFDAAGTRLASTAGTDPLVEVWDLDLVGRELYRLGLGEEARR